MNCIKCLLIWKFSYLSTKTALYLITIYFSCLFLMFVNKCKYILFLRVIYIMVTCKPVQFLQVRLITCKYSIGYHLWTNRNRNAFHYCISFENSEHMHEWKLLPVLFWPKQIFFFNHNSLLCIRANLKQRQSMITGDWKTNPECIIHSSLWSNKWPSLLPPNSIFFFTRTPPSFEYSKQSNSFRFWMW